ncbi:MAG: alpha/beta hydrolase family protein [Xenococcaceae cyanobacterium]
MWEVWGVWEETTFKVNLPSLLVQELNNFLSYNETTINAIAEQATREVNSEPTRNFEPFSDLREPGSYSVVKKTMTFEINEIRQTQFGFAIEKNSELQGLINWEQVGVLGDSFGGYTALALAGAPLNRDRINQMCRKNQPTLNVSMLLQCRASSLPPGQYNLKDPRIKAAIAVSPITSSVLGLENMSQISIPTILVLLSELSLLSSLVD